MTRYVKIFVSLFLPIACGGDSATLNPTKEAPDANHNASSATPRRGGMMLAMCAAMALGACGTDSMSNEFSPDAGADVDAIDIGGNGGTNVGGTAGTDNSGGTGGMAMMEGGSGGQTGGSGGTISGGSGGTSTPAHPDPKPCDQLVWQDLMLLNFEYNAVLVEALENIGSNKYRRTGQFLVTRPSTGGGVLYGIALPNHIGAFEEDINGGGYQYYLYIRNATKEDVAIYSPGKERFFPDNSFNTTSPSDPALPPNEMEFRVQAFNDALPGCNTYRSWIVK